MQKNILHTAYTVLAIIFVTTLASCGPDSKHIKLSGRLLNMNQGEFLVYSPDAALSSIDTLYVEGGRFSSTPSCSQSGSVVVLLPNGQEIPVFVKPGESYSIEGDAHSMKEVKVKGGKDNELMNEFRKKLKDKPESYVPTEEVKAFVEKNPKSGVCLYLIRHYYLANAKPDYSAAAKLLAKIHQQQPDNSIIKIMQSEVSELMNTSAGSSLPSFSVNDINGSYITDSQYSSGIAIFASQASWDFNSTTLVNRIISTMHEKNNSCKLVVISFDPSKSESRRGLNVNANDVRIVCDGNMAESTLAQKLAIKQTGIVIIARDGKIIERSKTGEDVIQELRKI